MNRLFKFLVPFLALLIFTWVHATQWDKRPDCPPHSGIGAALADCGVNGPGSLPVNYVFASIIMNATGDTITQPSGWNAGYTGAIPNGNEVASSYITINGTPTGVVNLLCNNTDGTATATIGCTLSASVTAGSAVIVLANRGDTAACPTSIVDAGANSYALLTYGPGTGAYACLFYNAGITTALAGGSTLTAQWAATGNSKHIRVYDITGLGRSAILVTYNGLGGNNNAPSCGIVGATYNPTGFSSAPWSCVIGSFK
jgi:hypothetical protein